MSGFIVKRLGFAVVTLFAVLTVVFFIVRILPGDPAMVILGDQTGMEAIEALRARLGLDRPLPVQYIDFMAGVLTGDWGRSLVSGRPVIQEILKVLPATIELTVVSLVLGAVTGVPLGVWSAIRRNRLPDYATRLLSLIGLSFPAFVSAVLLLLVFAIQLRWFPVISSGQGETFFERLRDLALPAVNLGLIMAAYITRVSRSAMLEVLGQDYVRTARAKGIAFGVIVWRHCLRNSMIPVVTVVGLYLGILIGNSVMIAIALACRPRLLIADESTTALDVTIQAQILDLIRELQREIGMSVMFITHEMGVVAEVADRVARPHGRGSPRIPAVHRSRTSLTRRLLAAVPKLGALRGQSMPRRFPNVDLRRVEGELGSFDDAAEEGPPEPDRRGDSILEVAGLTTRFPVRGGLFGRPVGNIHAVENVSFGLRASETLALVGESGCGKSTTGRSILGLVKAESGTVRFGNENLVELDRSALRGMRRRLQMVFQDPYGSLNPRKTVGAALREPLIVHGIAKGLEADHRVAELLDRVGLDSDHAFRFPHEFSGGQRQRICIARSLALEPSVLVADESVSALDDSIKAQVINLMMELQATMGLAFLFISHDIAVVERISHRVAVMYLGEIVEIGPRAAVLGEPQHPYTRQLIDAVPVPDPSLRRVRGGLMTEEIASPVRPLGYVPEATRMVEVGKDHYVRQPG